MQEMIAPCTCGLLAKWAKDCDLPIIERDGGYLIESGSINDPRLAIQFCPFCGEHGRPGGGNRLCECGVMDSLVENYPQLLEFDTKFHEFHILHSNRKGKLLIYYCFAC